MPAERSLLAHLYRRAGFGATSHELDVAETAGWTATVRHLLNGLHEPDYGAPGVSPPQFLPFVEERQLSASAAKAVEFVNLTNWWIELMASTSTPLREKLVLLLHCQFPTAYYKVDYPSLLYSQNEIFRKLGPGSFKTLTTEVSKDPAMLIWLDTGTDLVAHPNENFARELMERFALGIGHYTETDVKEAARAFTGWSVDYNSGQYRFNPQQHDWGVKTLLGKTGNFTGEEAISVVTRSKTSARWVVSRLWSWMGFPVGPHHHVVEDLAPAYTEDQNIGHLLEAMLNHPSFVSNAAMTGLVKQPVEWVVGALRALQIGPTAFPSGYVMNTLTHLGQQLFNPPTVGGWGYNKYWVSTSSSLSQLGFAVTAASVGDVSRIEDESPRSRVDSLANMLGLETWTRGTATSLNAVKDNPQQLVSLGLVSPEYLVN